MPTTTVPTKCPDLAALDYGHLWHPFTPMRQWREQPLLTIERGEGAFLIDTQGRRYIDGVSSLWCNVHGHRVTQIDQAIRNQLDQIAHTTLLGLGSVPSILLAEQLCQIAPHPLNKVFYSDAGATALEVAFKMAVGYWHHLGHPGKRRFVSLAGAYHGDTTGSMSVGFNNLMHHPFLSMVFDVTSFPSPNPCQIPPSNRPQVVPHRWPSEDEQPNMQLRDHCLQHLDNILQDQAQETAAVVVEPIVQGAAGMICQPPGFLAGVAELAHKHNVLLIADEVATGFGRTGTMFAVEHELQPNDSGPRVDIMCLAKGLSGGYLPLAATLCTDAIEEAFCNEPHQLEPSRMLYHGHTYTGNALACAAALASLERFESCQLLKHIQASTDLIHQTLEPLRDCDRFPHVLDVRQRGIMVGIELTRNRRTAEPFDPAQRIGVALCQAMRQKGLILRPLADVLVLMPIPAMDHQTLDQMLQIVVETLEQWPIAT